MRSFIPHYLPEGKSFLKEKASMEKPIGYDSGDEGWQQEWSDYNQHLASLQTIPCPSMPESWQSLPEIREDMFGVGYEVMDHGQGHLPFVTATKDMYDNWPSAKRIIAIPVDTGSGEEAYAALKPISDRINYFANRYHKYEANELHNALNVIMRLVPPENFTATPSLSPVEGGVARMANKKLMDLNYLGGWTSDQMVEMFIAGHASHTLHRSDAVEFAEWITAAGYDVCGFGKWQKVYSDADDETEYTTDELYHLFLNSINR